jgi:hypothetical protein
MQLSGPSIWAAPGNVAPLASSQSVPAVTPFALGVVSPKPSPSASVIQASSSSSCAAPGKVSSSASSQSFETLKPTLPLGGATPSATSVHAVASPKPSMSESAHHVLVVTVASPPASPVIDASCMPPSSFERGGLSSQSHATTTRTRQESAARKGRNECRKFSTASSATAAQRWKSWRIDNLESMLHVKRRARSRRCCGCSAVLSDT